MRSPPPTNPPAPLFPVTRWSVVAEACDSGEADSAAALEELCRNYWMPLYVAVRRFGHGPEDAKDLTQSFFARLLEKDWLHAADREKGRFRTFLMVALKRYRSLFREEIARTVRDEGEVEEEMRALMAALGA